MFLQPRPVPMILKDDSPMLEQCHYYWEIKLSHLQYRYSSEGWFGIGMSNVTQVDANNLIQHNLSKANFWGYGNNGTLAHNNEIKQYGPHFHEGDILGAHLDLHHGTLEFHRNRKPLGIAYTGLHENVPLYPVLIGATAIPMPNKIDGPYIFAPSLQLMCYRILTKTMTKEDILKAVPPGLIPLVNTFEFLHYFTGEPPKPHLYTSSYEMVIVSEEEENFEMPVMRSRRRNRRQAPSSQASSSSETNNNNQPSSSTSIPPRKRGRPRKVPLNTENTDHINQPSCSRSIPPCRGGRSRKVPLNTENTDLINNPSCSTSAPVRKRGRPKKVSLNSSDSIISPVRKTCTTTKRNASKKSSQKCGCCGC